MQALFVGGPQDCVILNIPPGADYYDFPVPPKESVAWISKVLPDEIQKLDVVRYKISMISIDRSFAIYTQCGDALNAMTRVRDFVCESNPGTILKTGREPQPIYTFPRRKP